MIKKFLLTSAALLSVTGAWAVELAVTPKFTLGETQVYDNVNYLLTGTTIAPVQTKPLTFTITNNNNGTVTIEQRSVETNTYAGTIDVAVSSITNSSTEVTITDFTIEGENSTLQKDPNTKLFPYNAENKVYTGLSGYSRNFLASAEDDNYKIVAYSSISKTNVYEYEYDEDDKEWSPSKKNKSIFVDHNYYYLYDKITTYYYVIKTININDYSDTKSVYNISYNVTQIGTVSSDPEVASIANGNSTIQDIRLNCDVATIVPGAFYGATAISSVKYSSSYKGTTPFEWDNDNSILYTAGKTDLIYAAINAAGTISLNNSVINIYNYAFYNIKKTAEVNSSLASTAVSLDKDTQGHNVTFNFTDPIIEGTENGGRGCTVTGTITNTDVATILAKAAYANCLYFDFSGASIRGEIEINNSAAENNILYYFPKGTTVTGTNKNVVIGNDCANFSLKDGLNFFNKKEFNSTTTAFLDRTIAQSDSKWGTIVLPFSVELNLTDYWIGKFYSYDEVNNSLTFAKVGSLAANTPYVIKNKTGNTKPFSVSGNVAIKATTAFTETFRGTFETLTNLGKDGCDYGYGTSGNFVKCGGSNTIKPFRAYFHIGSTTHQAPQVRFINEFEQEEFFEETAISEVSEDNAANIIYNTNGQRVANMKNAGVYVSNGKKVIVK